MKAARCNTKANTTMEDTQRILRVPTITTHLQRNMIGCRQTTTLTIKVKVVICKGLWWTMITHTTLARRMCQSTTSIETQKTYKLNTSKIMNSTIIIKLGSKEEEATKIIIMEHRWEIGLEPMIIENMDMASLTSSHKWPRESKAVEATRTRHIKIMSTTTKKTTTTTTRNQWTTWKT